MSKITAYDFMVTELQLLITVISLNNILTKLLQA